jgi:tetratricopeptide (TPR) repeat protein
MSLLLCRREPVTVPYEIEELGIHIWSSQELCYVIYNHPLLVMEDFINERLIAFLRSQLGLPFLAERIEKWIEGRGMSDELLFLILQECFYYTPQEQTRYRQEVTVLRKLPAEEFLKRRADYFYGLKLYGRAAAMYENILETGSEKTLSAGFMSRIWNNIAACYTKLFCYQKAMHAYDCAYSLEADKDYVKRMYFLTLMEPEIEMKERYEALMSEEEKEEWMEEMVKAQSNAEKERPAVEIGQLFEKDPVKRLSGATELLNKWKVEYRRMI